MRETDVIILGTGAAGMAATLAARTKTGAEVLLVEKWDRVGRVHIGRGDLGRRQPADARGRNG